MKKLRTSRPAFPNSRWLAYAIAGAATSLVNVATADAEIHYSGPVDIPFNNTKPERGSKKHRKFPLAQGADMFFGRNTYGVTYVADKFGVVAAVSNQVRGRSLFAISRLTRGEKVSGGEFYDLNQPFNYPYALMVSIYGSGNFNARGEAFIGFKFNTGKGTQYGWARVVMGGSHRYPHREFSVKDYAWGDAGDSIVTGQTSSSETQEPGAPASESLGFLALGAAGLVSWRKARSHRATIG